MKKIIYIILLFFVMSCNVVYADMYDSVLNDEIKDSINNSFEIVTDELGGEFDALSLINEINSGKFDTGFDKLVSKLKFTIALELRNVKLFFVRTLAVILIVSTIKLMNTDSKKNNASSLVCIAVVMLSLLHIFFEITDTVINTIDTLVLFINSLIPVLMTLTAGTGKIITAGILSPVMLGASSVVTLIIKSVIIPFAMFGNALNFASSATGKTNLSAFGNQLNTLTKWLTGLMLTLYMGLVSVIGTVTPKIDEITLKAAKYAVGSFIPYVGSMLSDSVELVLNCSGVVRNSVGIVGLICIITVVALPCIQITVKVLMFKLLAVIVSPVSDETILDCLKNISSGLSVMLGLVFVVAVMYILSVAVIIYIGGA